MQRRPTLQCMYVHMATLVTATVCVYHAHAGRSIRVSVGDSRRISEFLTIAATLAGFDWVQYTSRQYVRLTVVPTGKCHICLHVIQYASHYT